MSSPTGHFDALKIQPLTDQEFSQFQKMIYDWAGIHMTEAKKALVAGRLMKRLRHYNINSYGAYLKILNKGENAAEKQVLIDLLTTNETYFFREPKHFEFLRDTVLPSYRSAETFRVWSAACSSGEEVYTIAMILADHFGFSGWEIMGSDINQAVIEEARDGIYLLEDAENIPRDYLKKYCLKGVRSQAGRFTIIKELRERITFRQINLIEPLPGDIGMFDMIFLRNVMIYFNRETKQKIVERLIQVMKPTGYLLVGHAESLHGVTDRVKTVIPTVYKKV